jgi:broad specificity phosphatase PhoE
VGLPSLFLARHGETEWSATGRHTGRTDVGLNDNGREQARALGSLLAGYSFGLVLCSPLQRARETCFIAGYGDRAELDGDLQEWDYGDYEGSTTDEIRTTRPGWNLWRDGCPDGEAAAQVAVRADRVIARVRAAPHDALAFAHGHLLRAVAARWIGEPATAGRLFALDTATVSVLGWEREQAVIRTWNRNATP